MEEFEFPEGPEPDTSQSSSPQLVDEPSEMENVGEDNDTQSKSVDSPTGPRRSGGSQGGWRTIYHLLN